jgi:hypothetical protein
MLGLVFGRRMITTTEEQQRSVRRRATVQAYHLPYHDPMIAALVDLGHPACHGA